MLKNNSDLLLPFVFPFILILYLLITVGYGVVNPLFEAPDEHHHFFTALYIAETGQHPPADETTLARQEAAQPPLYYWLAALLIKPIDNGDAAASLWSNPYVQAGIADSPANINAFIHTPREAWPWRGWVLSAHLIRLLSTLLGLGTLLCVYGCARDVFAEEWGESKETEGNRGESQRIQARLTPNSSALSVYWPLVTVALVAFLPQFNFIHATISNDPLITFLSAAALWQMVRIQYPNTVITNPSIHPLRLFLLGLTIGLAILSKTAGLLLLGLAGLFFIGMAWRLKRPRLLLDAFLYVALPALLLSGWLLWRNWLLYGDPTAASRFVDLAGGDRAFTLRQLWGEAGRVWFSFLGIFGWMNVRPLSWIYTLWHTVILLSLIGTLLHLIRSHTSENVGRFAKSPYKILRSLFIYTPSLLSPQPSALFFWGWLWVGLLLAGWVQFALRTSADQGRLLFPALLPLVLTLVAGMRGWRRIEVGWGAAAAALLTTLTCLFLVIPRAYAPPTPFSPERLPADLPRLNLEMGQGIWLVAVQVETTTAQPGQDVWVQLYWQAETIPAEPPLVYLSLVGREHTLVGEWVGYHGGGRYPATLWPTGLIVSERLPVRLFDWMDAPTQVGVTVQLDPQTERVPVGWVTVRPLTWPPSTGETLAQFGEGIVLEAVQVLPDTARPGEQVEIRVRWRAAAAIHHPYTTFIHLGDPTQPPVAQGDGPQVNGNYPTHLWQAGEIIEDSYILPIPPDLPPGVYPLHIGFYDPITGGRLPITGPHAYPYLAYPLPALTVK